MATTIFSKTQILINIYSTEHSKIFDNLSKEKPSI